MYLNALSGGVWAPFASLLFTYSRRARPRTRDPGINPGNGHDERSPNANDRRSMNRMARKTTSLAFVCSCEIEQSILR